MFQSEINSLKKKISKENFNLVLSIFKEDVEFHKRYRSYTDKELSEVLGQAYSLVMKLM